MGKAAGTHVSFLKIDLNEHQLKYKENQFCTKSSRPRTSFIISINRELCCGKSSSTLGSVMKARSEGKEVIVKDIVN